MYDRDKARKQLIEYFKTVGEIKDTRAIIIDDISEWGDANRTNIVCVRENKTNLRTSVYRQVREALEMMELVDEFMFFVSPMDIVYKQTESSFVFNGVNHHSKLKSDKIPNIIGLWYEEAANIKSTEVFDQVNPTFISNKSPCIDEVKIFYSYNPPKNPYDWINECVEKKRTNLIA